MRDRCEYIVNKKSQFDVSGGWGALCGKTPGVWNNNKWLKLKALNEDRDVLYFNDGWFMYLAFEVH